MSDASKRNRRDQARETARLEREKELKKRGRRRLFIQGGVVLGALVIALVIVLVVVAANPAAGPGPKNMASGGIVFTGSNNAIVATQAPAVAADATPVANAVPSDGKAHIVTYVDWACPVCKTFETTYADQISAFVGAGTTTLEVHPVAILDRNYQGSRYSSRANNAADCVANYVPDKFLAVQAAFYANQPAEGTSGFTNTEIKAQIKGAGADTPDVLSCVDNETFKGWVKADTTRVTTDSALADPTSGGFGTPTVMVNGQRWDGKTNFLSFVAGFITSGATSTPTPTPAATN